MAALVLGKKTADLTEADLPAIKDVLLKMKANAKLVGEVTASQTALATGEVDILVGGGEWVTAGLAKENPALDFSIPKEGGILWSQSLAMFAASKNKDTRPEVHPICADRPRARRALPLPPAIGGCRPTARPR